MFTSADQKKDFLSEKRKEDLNKQHGRISRFQANTYGLGNGKTLSCYIFKYLGALQY